MDARIYLYISFHDIIDPNTPQETINQLYLKNRLIVVDDDAPDGETWKLPDFGCEWYFTGGYAVADSRLFILGGYPKGYKGPDRLNWVLSANIHGGDGGSWEADSVGYPPEGFGYLVGAEASKEGDSSIYAIGTEGNLLVFSSKTRSLKENVYGGKPRNSTSALLAVTDTKIYVNCVNKYEQNATLGYYDIASRTWNTMFDDASLWELVDRVVVVMDKYMVNFSIWNPLTSDYGPCLYVYDILQRKWLDNPVEGLLNDDLVLPSSDWRDLDSICIKEPSLMQIRSNELKFAMVWHDSFEVDRLNIHLSKFTLTIQAHEEVADVPTTTHEDVINEEVDHDAPLQTSKDPVFKAENVLSFSPYCDRCVPFHVRSMTEYK